METNKMEEGKTCPGCGKEDCGCGKDNTCGCGGH